MKLRLSAHKIPAVALAFMLVLSAGWIITTLLVDTTNNNDASLGKLRSQRHLTQSKVPGSTLASTSQKRILLASKLGLPIDELENTVSAQARTKILKLVRRLENEAQFIEILELLPTEYFGSPRISQALYDIIWDRFPVEDETKRLFALMEILKNRSVSSNLEPEVGASLGSYLGGKMRTTGYPHVDFLELRNQIDPEVFDSFLEGIRFDLRKNDSASALSLFRSQAINLKENPQFSKLGGIYAASLIDQNDIDKSLKHLTEVYSENPNFQAEAFLAIARSSYLTAEVGGDIINSIAWPNSELENKVIRLTTGRYASSSIRTVDDVFEFYLSLSSSDDRMLSADLIGRILATKRNSSIPEKYLNELEPRVRNTLVNNYNASVR